MNKLFFKYVHIVFLLNLAFLTSCLEEGSTQSLSSTSEDNVIPKSVIVDKNGNLGIWTLTPATLLHVQNLDGNYGSMMLGGNLNTKNHFITHETDGSFNIYDGVFGSGTNRLRIESGGYVGIGTANPSEKFDIASGNIILDNNYAYKIATAAGVASNILSMTGTDNVQLVSPSTGAMQLMATGNTTQQFWTNGSERMRIDGSGNVGIGTSSASSKLTVSGTIETTSGGIKFPDGTIQLSAAPPVGSILTMMTATCPSGYLSADGSAVLRATYANLFAAVAVMYGAGDGSTTFNLPDLRGYFLRGWDNGSGNDPNAATRTNRGDGSTGDLVGTKQADDFKSHTHGHDGFFVSSYLVGDGDVDGSTQATGYDKNTIAGTIANTGGNETRPKNINVLYCIKY